MLLAGPNSLTSMNMLEYLRRCLGPSQYGQPRCVIGSCWCCSLKTAAKVIAVIEMVLYFGIFLGLVTVLTGTRHTRYELPSWTMVVLLHWFLAIVLMHGARKEDRGLLWAWVWAKSVFLLKTLPYFTLIIATHYYVLPVVLILSVVAAFIIFSVVCIRSFALELKAKSTLSDQALHYDNATEELYT